MKRISLIFFILIMFFSAVGCGEQSITGVDEKLQLTKQNYEIIVGESTELLYSVSDLKDGTTIIINSLDSSIIKIDGKTMEALKEGSTSVEVYLSSVPDIKYTITVIATLESVVEEKLTLEKDNYEIVVGESTEILYLVSDLKEETTVIINSLDTSIVEIEGKMIKALKAGSTSVEIYLSSNPDTKYTIAIVITPQPIEVAITNKTEEIGLFSSFSFTGYINDENKFTSLKWTTSDETVLSIDEDGNAEGLALGKVTVTLFSTLDETITDEVEVEVVVDPLVIFDLLSIDNVLVQNVTSYGNDTKTQLVLGSVSRYSFSDLTIVEEIVPINTNDYTGQVATPSILETVEPLKKVRPGILLESLDYIVYHDTGNNNAGTDAKNHANYMVGEWNAGDRARSWHYTVDENVVYHHIPDNEVTWQGDSYDAYAKSIGIETCVNYGANLYHVWQNAGKLMASLLDKYNLDISDIKQHYDMSGKNCPQTLRRNNLYSYAISLVEGEYMVLEYLSDYEITFTSLTPEYLDDDGSIKKQPINDTVVSYLVTCTKDNESVSKVYFSNIEGSSDIDFEPTEDEIKTAEAFDTKVSALVKAITQNDAALINSLVEEYKEYSASVKEVISTYSYLKQKEYELLLLNEVSSTVVFYSLSIGTTMTNNCTYYDYVNLYNLSNQEISLQGMYLDIKTSNDSYQYYFKDDVVIKANGYLLIAFNELKDAISFESVQYSLPLPDIIMNYAIKDENFSISLKDASITYDTVGFGNSTVCEEETLQDYCVVRKQLIDTDNNSRDFEETSFNVYNSSNEYYSTGSQINEFDYQVLLLNRSITEDDEEEIMTLLQEYEDFTNERKATIKTKDILDKIYVELQGIKNPSILIVHNVISQIPERIVDDYTLPVVEGVTYKYAVDADSSYYNLETGEYLKLSHEAKLITIIVCHGDVEEECTINFGIASPNDTIIYNTGKVTPSGGKTSDGYGTLANQTAKTGFGGVAIIVDEKVFFIGKSCLINLSSSSANTTLTRTDLRPLGGDLAFYNYGIVNGVATQYAGTGALYYNSGDYTLSFDLNDTYGRNNNGAYGYFKIRFSPNNDGGYTVSEILPNTGSNESATKYIINLEPGEYIWCPHTYETTVDGGTWLINPASSTSGGVLSLNVTLEIIYYKNSFN